MIAARLTMTVMVLSVVVYVHSADQQEWNKQLFVALQNDAPSERIQLLVGVGADVKAIKEFDAGGSSALHYAVMSNRQDISLILNLIELHKIDVNGKDCAGATPCHVAAAYDKVDFIEILYDKGADINAKNIVGYTPLHFASVNGAAKAVEFLLEHGADKEAMTDNGLTPAKVALNYGYENIAYYIESYPVISDIKQFEED